LKRKQQYKSIFFTEFWVSILYLFDETKGSVLFIFSTPAEDRKQGGMKQIVEQGLNLSGS